MNYTMTAKLTSLIEKLERLVDLAIAYMERELGEDEDGQNR